jgi:hypothetical protein
VVGEVVRFSLALLLATGVLVVVVLAVLTLVQQAAQAQVRQQTEP